MCGFVVTSIRWSSAVSGHIQSADQRTCARQAASAARQAGQQANLHDPELENQIVDGDEMVRFHLSTQLKRLDYRVVEAASGPEAMKLLDQLLSFDLLFTDLVLLGGMNGRQLADFARKSRPDLRILFTSGYTTRAQTREGRLDPGVELLSKPYRRPQLAPKVAHGA